MAGKRVVGRPDEKGLLVRHPEEKFGRQDVLSVPVGHEAALVRDGLVSVYRAGDEPELGSGLFRRPGALYFIDVQSTDALPWGMGGILCEGRSCGMHGTLRLRVGSSRKFLNAHMGEALPLTAQRAFEGVLESCLGAMRAALAEASRQTPLDALVRRPSAVVDAAMPLLEERLEESGLALEALFIEEIFVAGADEQEDEQ